MSDSSDKTKFDHETQSELPSLAISKKEALAMALVARQQKGVDFGLVSPRHVHIKRGGGQMEIWVLVGQSANGDIFCHGMELKSYFITTSEMCS